MNSSWNFKLVECPACEHPVDPIISHECPNCQCKITEEDRGE